MAELVVPRSANRSPRPSSRSGSSEGDAVAADEPRRRARDRQGDGAGPVAGRRRAAQRRAGRRDRQGRRVDRRRSKQARPARPPRSARGCPGAERRPRQRRCRCARRRRRATAPADSGHRRRPSVEGRAATARRSPSTARSTGRAAQARAATRAARRSREEQPPPRRRPSASIAGSRRASALAPRSTAREVVPMSPLRKRVAERLVQAQHEAAIADDLQRGRHDRGDGAARAKYKEQLREAHGVKLGFMSFFVKACVAALKLFPGVNAEVLGGNIVYKKHYDFGIAVVGGEGPRRAGAAQRATSCRSPGVEKGILELAEQGAQTASSTLDRSAGRHVHDHERRHLRLDDVDAAAQLSADRHPRHAQHRRSARWWSATRSRCGR